VLELIFEMSHALIVLENHEIIHGNITTKNIFISNDGSFKLGLNYYFYYFNLNWILLLLIGDYIIYEMSGILNNRIEFENIFLLCNYINYFYL
jgi:hypothetical protein